MIFPSCSCITALTLKSDEANGDNAVGDAYNIVPVILIIGAAISALALLKVKK